MSVACLDCRTSFLTTEPHTSFGFRGLYDFIVAHRHCTLVYDCKDGSKFLCKLGENPLSLNQ